VTQPVLPQAAVLPAGTAAVLVAMDMLLLILVVAVAEAPPM
jgi:hypothetical protein